jgi:hypothetical protein
VQLLLLLLLLLPLLLLLLLLLSLLLLGHQRLHCTGSQAAVSQPRQLSTVYSHVNRLRLGTWLIGCSLHHCLLLLWWRMDGLTEWGGVAIASRTCDMNG